MNISAHKIAIPPKYLEVNLAEIFSYNGDTTVALQSSEEYNASMLYTRKGDRGTTKVFDSGSGQRISKSSQLAETLGTMDEVNSFLGLCKEGARAWRLTHMGVPISDVVHSIQKDLFIIQAELAGAEKSVTEDKVKSIENLIDSIERILPPITTFFISGGTELAARFDVARTLARRAERRVVAVHESGERSLGDHTRAYMNRLSSVLYALARLANHKSGIKEESPDYR